MIDLDSVSDCVFEKCLASGGWLGAFLGKEQANGFFLVENWARSLCSWDFSTAFPLIFCSQIFVACCRMLRQIGAFCDGVRQESRLKGPEIGLLCFGSDFA